MINQKILKEGETGTVYTLSQFAEKALRILEEEGNIDEVVILANSIKEMQNDHITPPSCIYPLPEGYEYHFSGFFGQVLGIMRKR
ncbi:MAG: hypothetical protein AYK18_06975 [Theionarchaea archaeon DG-70]|nr:MAG: hypothetical protein AYK18_06975 [Theionarchaea archaeon DG-70]